MHNLILIEKLDRICCKLALKLYTLALNVRESDHSAVFYRPHLIGPYWERDT